jgi:hypothetical protein
LLEVGYFDEEGIEPPAGEAAEPGGHQRLRTVSISLVVDQSEKVAGKKKSRYLPPTVAQKLIDLHCPRSDGIDVFCGISFIECRATRLDVDGARDRCEAFLFLGGQWGTRRKLGVLGSCRKERRDVGDGNPLERPG